MANINLVILTGRVGQDPEIKRFESGTTKSSLSVATTESRKDKEGNWKDETQWHRVEIWNQDKMIEKHVKKGSVIMVQGKLVYEKYKNNAGEEKEIAKIVADKIDLGQWVKGEGQSNTSTPSNDYGSPSNTTTVDDDSLPF